MSDAGILDVPTTIAQLPFFASGRFPKPDLIGHCTAAGVTSISGRELLERVRDLSLGFSRLGMQRGDRVVLLSESRPDWLFTDLAVLAAGGIITPIYPTLSAEQVLLILRDSEPVIAVVSNAPQLSKLLGIAPEVPSLRTIVLMDKIERPSDARLPTGVQLLALDDVAAGGHREILDGWGVGRAFLEAANKIRPEDPATLIYTSGTTGTPKGVLLTHGNLAANVSGVLRVLELNQDDVALSFLPLCHAFERTVSYVYLASGVSIVFAESLDTIRRDLERVRPTVMTGVPRVFEKLQARVLEAGRASGGLKRAIFDRAVRLAEERGERLSTGRALSWTMRLESRLAERLVFRRVREVVGGRLRYAVSGGAPLRPDVGKFFYGVGLPILEGYGLTETAPVLCVMPLGAVRFGTVGPPLPNVEIAFAPDGEILARGPNVMSGYYHRPDDTAQALHEGWFHTGDIGSLDDHGYLRITDRKKELIVTSGGKKIAPQGIEAALKRHPVIEEAVLIAEQRHFVTALLVPNFPELCRRLGVGVPSDELAARALVEGAPSRALFQAAVDAENERLAQFERIKKFSVIPREFSIATGELTPTLKVKRRVVEQKYREPIEAMYA